MNNVGQKITIEQMDHGLDVMSYFVVGVVPFLLMMN